MNEEQQADEQQAEAQPTERSIHERLDALEAMFPREVKPYPPAPGGPVAHLTREGFEAAMVQQAKMFGEAIELLRAQIKTLTDRCNKLEKGTHKGSK